jgi:hypothetical protein
MFPLPKIDARTAPEFARDVLRLLPAFVDNWPAVGEEDDNVTALVNVFARYGEIVVERLNRAPEKNFLAFLDMVGVVPLPMESARAPLTFSLAPGSLASVVVPKGTQVAAAPPKGKQNPVIFETELDLVVVPVTLASLLLKNGECDQYVDMSELVTPPPEAPPAEGSGVTPAILQPTATVPESSGQVRVLPHAFFVGIKSYPVWPLANTVRLRFDLESDAAPPVDPQTVQWELCLPPRAKPAAALAVTPNESVISIREEEDFQTITLTPLLDGTANLTKSGEVVFLNLTQMIPTVVGGLSGSWLRCRLLTAITRSADRVPGMVRESQLPAVKTLRVETVIDRPDLTLEKALLNSQQLDVSKDFFAFGDKPKFGDTLYLACREAFSNPDAELTLNVTLTNPKDEPGSPVPSVEPHEIKLTWEFWDGRQWTLLGTNGTPVPPQPARTVKFVNLTPAAEPTSTRFSDATQAFSKSGEIRFRFSKPPAELTLNGERNYWVRARISAGDYGRDAHYEGEPGKHNFVWHPATFAPPLIKSVKVGYSVQRESTPEALVRYNNFVYSAVASPGGAFQPFMPARLEEALPALYFGFTLPSLPAASATAPPQAQRVPAATKFLNRSMSIYVALNDIGSKQSTDTSGALVAVWEYWNGQNWTKWTVRDSTQGVQRSGMIRFLPPKDFVLSKEFGRDRYWLRMRQNDPGFQPKVRRALLNTTEAVEGATIENDILGASNGKPAQKFRTTQTPVLAGQVLEVREPKSLPLKEIKDIEELEGAAAILRVNALHRKGSEFWVRWHERPNFYGSGPRDRHYVINRMSGEVLFGDGVKGMIPPALPGNIRMAKYRTGGGSSGNTAAQTIKQLKTAVPGVQKVMNWEPADGGSDMEPNAAVMERGPRQLRHGWRAVTLEDFEDLAVAGSRKVARAKCVPLYDLSSDPDVVHRKGGIVSLVIVPRSTDARPLPGAELMSRVQSFLERSCEPLAQLILVGPEYVRINVETEIAVNDPDTASEVELGVKRALDRFLHPLTGGLNGRGWDFGRLPHGSDLFEVIEKIRGVSHVRELRMSSAPDRPGAEKTDRFLVCCGFHTVTTTLEE